MDITLRQRTKFELIPFLIPTWLGHYRLCRKHVGVYRSAIASNGLVWVMFKKAPNKYEKTKS